MDSDFLAAVDAAVEQALPADWPRVSAERLPACGGARARHAFRRRTGDGAAAYLAVAADAAAAPATPSDLAALVELVLDRGAGLLLLYEARSPIADWIQDNLDFPHPRLLTLACMSTGEALARPLLGGAVLRFPRAAAAAGGLDTAPGGLDTAPGGLDTTAGGLDTAGGGPERATSGLEAPAGGLETAAGGLETAPRDPETAIGDRAPEPAGWLAEPTWNGPEPLAWTVRDLWSGALCYEGPVEGRQTAGVELLRDVCWRCCRSLATVTGIVLPDRAVEDWTAPDWSYFQQLIELGALPDAVVDQLSAAIEGWRAHGEGSVTPIRWRYGKTVASSHWAAECPFCGAFRGSTQVLAERLPHLASLASRRSGVLRYRAVEIDLPRQLLHDLTWSCDLTPHARPFGWRRAGSSLLGPGDAGALTQQADGSLLAAASEPAARGCHRAGLASAVATATTAGPAAGPAALPRAGAGLALPSPAHSPIEARSGTWRRLGHSLAAWLDPRRFA